MGRKKEKQGSLSEQLNQDVVSQLQVKKAALKQQADKQQELERLKRIEEKQKREANKSFEELLNESDLDWKSFKH
ncbi:YqkE family protein [Halobacillus rhizosphaerae]|uniref:YqkE family protein n=1 Tax=Halobacillus rhizosphaerae TaxID=3064889 RepID=UPI00398B8437